MFFHIYQSPWHHPGLAWLAGVPFLVLFLVAARAGRKTGDRDPRRRAWLWAFAILEVEILIDAAFTGALSPLAGHAAEVAAVVFVILGDLRFFYFVERQRGEAAPSLRAALHALAVALPVTMLVPVTTAALRAHDAVRFQGNFLYLVYEAAMVLVTAGFSFLRAPRVNDRADRRRRYVLRLTAFEGAQYGLWVLADALILLGRDVGWLVRLAPNALYYVCFVPVATWATPSGTRV